MSCTSGLTFKEADEAEDSDETDDDVYFIAMHTRPYEKLIVWKEAHDLCLWVYKQSRSFPDHERNRLVGQMCRSAYGVPMNIAEGNAKRTKKDKARFFDIAIGSLEELHYQCRLARDLSYLSPQLFADADDRIQRTSFLLTKLRSAVLTSSESSASSASSASSV